MKGCSLLSSSFVWPCMPDRWCREKQDELYSLKHCTRQVCLLLINLKLSCRALVRYDIISKHCWSLDRWASFDINSHNVYSLHINILLLLPLCPAHHATVGTVLFPGTQHVPQFPQLFMWTNLNFWLASAWTNSSHIVWVAGHGHWPQWINT